jgi:hypothetical protein
MFLQTGLDSDFPERLSGKSECEIEGETQPIARGSGSIFGLRCNQPRLAAFDWPEKKTPGHQAGRRSR